MRTVACLVLLALGLAPAGPVGGAVGDLLRSAPPVVVATEPQAGRTDVAPGPTEIRVTFSKPMVCARAPWTRTVVKNFFRYDRVSPLRAHCATKESIMTPTSERVELHTTRFLDRMEQRELAIVRRAYAKHVLANASVDDVRVEAAFAAVRREHFLGPGPWPMPRWARPYVPTPSDDPVYLYQDALVGIIPERDLNNGQPSLHATLIAAVDPRPGEHAVHIGAGSATTRPSWHTWWARPAGSRQSNSMAALPCAFR